MQVVGWPITSFKSSKGQVRKYDVLYKHEAFSWKTLPLLCLFSKACVYFFFQTKNYRMFMKVLQFIFF